LAMTAETPNKRWAVASGGAYKTNLPEAKQKLRTSLTYNSNQADASTDESVLTHPFKTADYNDDERLRTGL
jgi:hypothetical protein